MAIRYAHPRHVTIPCRSGLDGDIAFSELFDHDGRLIKRFELPVANEHGDEFEAVRQVEGQAIQLWNQLEAERERQQRAQQQGEALMAAFQDDRVFDLLVAKVAAALAAKQAE